MQNQLILGDNLEILKSLPSESVDLIYIDPPFFSNRNYEVIWGDDGEIRSFKDRWSGGMSHYIEWLKDRVEEMYRILKPTGSMYLHCDWHADAYIRVNILDKIFGMGNFRNEIVWQYFMGGKPKKFYARKHDTIFFYTKTDKYNFNYFKIKRYLDFVPSLKDESKDADNGKDDIGYWSMVGCPDVWPIKGVFNMSNEAIGYPTQKPEALLERIIKASSNEGDVVLDCFVGGGTTVAVADKLKRKWIGIDQSVAAIAVTEARLDKQGAIKIGGISSTLGLAGSVYSVKLHKYDYDMIRYSDAFEFENWIVEQFGGEFNSKQRGDMGLDGKKDGVPIQVKRSDGIGRNVVDNFKSAMGRFYGAKFDSRKGDKATDGYIIAFSFGKGAVEEAARLKNEEGLIIELIKVEDIVAIAKKPKLELAFEDLGIEKDKRKVKLTAKSDVEIDIYQWDFNYDEKTFKPSEMFEKTNEIITEFDSGSYLIACKCVDNDGISTIETMKLKVNGVVNKI